MFSVSKLSRTLYKHAEVQCIYHVLAVQVKNGIPNEGIMRLIYRSAYVVLIAFIACTLPFFGDLMGFFGALGNGPTSFWM